MEDLLVFGSAILILVAIILQTQAIMWLSTARHLMKARALREDLEFLGEIIPQAIQEAMKVYPAGDEEKERYEFINQYLRQATGKHLRVSAEREGSRCHATTTDSMTNCRTAT